MNQPTQENKTLLASNGQFTLSDESVSLKGQRRGFAYQMHIFLEDVGSVEYLFRYNKTLMILAILFMILAIVASMIGVEMAGDEGLGFGMLPFIFSLIFWGLWWNSRKKILRITSQGGTHLDLSIVKLSETAIQKILHSILQAKNDRIQFLSGIHPQSLSHHE